MGEEVETVLPAGFVPTPDPVKVEEKAKEAAEVVDASDYESEPEESACGGKRGRRSKKKRSSSSRSSRKSLLSRWRSSRSKSRSRNVESESNASGSGGATKDGKKKRSKSKSKSKLSFRTIKKVDSNATEIRSNTTKSKSERDVEAKKEDEAKTNDEDVASANDNSTHLPTVREGSPANTTVTATTGEDLDAAQEKDADAASKQDDIISVAMSVEVGDENEHVEVPVEAPSAEKETSPSTDDNVVAADDTSVRSSKSTKSNKSTKSTASAKSGRSVSSKRSLRSLKSLKKAKEEEKPQDEAENTSDKENAGDEPAPTEQKTKWTKKVSLSIGGYKTSFQVSDPMSSLADAVNDALDVVAPDDTNLVKQAKEHDNLHEDGDTKEDEQERDYDENPTRFFMYLQQRAWGLALTQLQKHPEEASIWVYRKAKSEKAPNVADADQQPGALVVQHTALVVHDGTEMPKFRWRLLPLHAAIVLGAPTEIIQDIVRAYPGAAKKTDERGSLPVHLAASRLDVDPEGEKVVLQLFGAYPDSIEIQDRKGRTPPELAKLAKARKDTEEQRKINAVSASQASQIGQECTASQYGNAAGEEEEGSGESKADDGDDDDDDASVKSSVSAKFKHMLRRSRSTDTVDRRKKKNKKDAKADESLALIPAKSLDHDDMSVADSTIIDSLGPGFSFTKTSKKQEEREQTATAAEEATDDKTDEELLIAHKKALVSKDYETPAAAPQDTSTPRSIPLPMSFSMGDDTSSTAAPTVVTEIVRSSTPPTAEDSNESPKAVTISEEIQTQTIPEDTEAAPGKASEQEPVNEGLRNLLEKAVDNAGRGGMDVTGFVKILEDEWVTDVEALRRLDGETLDDLLPLMLSRELQRLINHADSIDNKFLKDDQSRGRSPKKSSKKKKKRSHRRFKKRGLLRPVTPPNGTLAPITEATEDHPANISPGSVESDDQVSIVTEAQTVCTTRSAPSKLQVIQQAVVEEEREENAVVEEERVVNDSDSNGDDSGEDEEIQQCASIEDLEIRKLHANLIADARQKFPTREKLEDSIAERQAEVEAAVNSGFDVDKETLARAALADDEVRKLLPLRLILPTATDLNEMISVLQMHKEVSIRNLDMGKAQDIQSEIDELQDQIIKEEQYVLRKKMGETKCSSCGVSFPTEKKKSGILKVREKNCESCRNGGDGGAIVPVQPVVETVDSRDDEAN